MLTTDPGRKYATASATKLALSFVIFIVSGSNVSYYLNEGHINQMK